MSYYDNHGSPRGAIEWKQLEYKYEDVDGVISFIDGFMSSGGRSKCSETFEVHAGIMRKKEIAVIYLPTKADEKMVRLTCIRGAVKMLCAK